MGGAEASSDAARSPFGDADREALQALLDAPSLGAKAMAIDELQGFFVATATGPDAAPPDDWVSIVLGTPAESLGEVAPPGLVDLLDRFRAATARALDDGTLEIAPRRLRTGRLDYGGFCRGFLDGVDTTPTDWFDAADPDEIAELIFPIEVLGDALEADERAAYAPAEWRTLVRSCEAGLPETVARLAGYWRIVRTPVATIRRDVPKVGRNDPCPCGSGRKFKHCHGRS